MFTSLVEYSKLVEAMKKEEFALSVRKAMNEIELPYEDSFKRRLLLNSIVAERAVAERKSEEYLRLVRELITKSSSKLANGDMIMET